LFDFEDVNKYDENRMRVISKNVPFRIDWALGGCVMIKRSVLGKIGLFDERFFLYCEDIDWFYRLKKANLAAYCFPESIMRHKHLAVSDHKLFSIESYYHFIGIMKFIVKHFNDILTGQYEL
jgi:GT2 family glycosyltransferase